MPEGKRDFILVNSIKRKKGTRERWLLGTFSLPPMKINQEWATTMAILEQIPLGNKWNTTTLVLGLVCFDPSGTLSQHQRAHLYEDIPQTQMMPGEWQGVTKSKPSMGCLFNSQCFLLISSCHHVLSGQSPALVSAGALWSPDAWIGLSSSPKQKCPLCVWQQCRGGLLHWADYSSQGWQVLLACKHHVSSVPRFRGRVQKQQF